MTMSAHRQEPQVRSADEPLLTVTEVSRLLHVSPRTLRAWCQQDTVPHLRIAGNIRFDRQAIESWLDRQRRG